MTELLETAKNNPFIETNLLLLSLSKTRMEREMKKMEKEEEMNVGVMSDCLDEMQRLQESIDLLGATIQDLRQQLDKITEALALESANCTGEELERDSNLKSYQRASLENKAFAFSQALMGYLVVTPDKDKLLGRPTSTLAFIRGLAGVS